MEDCQIPEAFMDEKTLSHVTNNERVDESVKKFEVEFNSNSTKVTKVIVELKENYQ